MNAIHLPTTVVTKAQLAALSANLVAVGDRLEAEGSPDWLPVARAATVLDGLRLDLVEIPAASEGNCHG